MIEASIIGQLSRRSYPATIKMLLQGSPTGIICISFVAGTFCSRGIADSPVIQDIRNMDDVRGTLNKTEKEIIVLRPIKCRA